MVRHLEFRYVSQRGSLINIAVCALCALTRQSMRGRRIGDLEELRRATGAWVTDVNEQLRGVDWQLTVADIRHKSRVSLPQNRGGTKH